MGKQLKDLGIALVCLGLLAIYVYKHIDKNPAKHKRIYTVEIEGRKIPIREVQALEIPQKVYEGMDSNPKWKEYLLGKKKQVILFTWDGCPYKRAYRDKFDKIVKRPEISKNFTTTVIVTEKTVMGHCSFDEKNYHGQSCPAMWLVSNCVGGVCIINPKTREAIVDFSRNPEQLAALLEHYTYWDENSLFTE